MKQLVVVLTRTAVRLADARADEPCEWAHNGPEDLREALTAAWRAGGHRRARLEVQLDSSIVQLRTLVGLPPLRTRPLGELVEHQSARFFRRNGHPLRTAVHRPAVPKRLVFPPWRAHRAPGPPPRAAAVEAIWLEALAGAAAELPLRQSSLLVRAGCEGLSFRVPARGAAERRRETRRLLVTFSLAVLAWLGCLGVWLVQLDRTERALDRRLAALAKPVAAVEQANRAAAMAGETIMAIDEMGRRRGDMIRRLELLTDSLPSAGFLTGARLAGDGRGVLEGFATEPDAYAARVRAAGLRAVLDSNAAAGQRAPAGAAQRFRLRLEAIADE